MKEHLKFAVKVLLSLFLLNLVLDLLGMVLGNILPINTLKSFWMNPLDTIQSLPQTLSGITGGLTAKK